MDPFLQDAPQAANRFRADSTLRNTLERILPPDAFAEASPLFDEMSEHALTDMKALSLHAEAHPPVHVPFDAWGRRVDKIDVDPECLALVRIGQGDGVVEILSEDGLDE